MYSVILMTVMSSAGQDPACHFRCRPYCPPPCYTACCGYYPVTCGCGGYGGVGFGGYACGGACLGCYGVYPTYSYSMPLNAVPITPGVPVTPGTPSDPVLPKPKPKPEDPEKADSTAKLVFDLPAGATLYVDGQLIKGAAVRRQFSTPKLDRGQAYYYDVRVEVVRGGKVVADEKRVIVRAGDVATAKFSDTNTIEGSAYVAITPKR